MPIGVSPKRDTKEGGNTPEPPPPFASVPTSPTGRYCDGVVERDADTAGVPLRQEVFTRNQERIRRWVRRHERKTG